MAHGVPDPAAARQQAIIALGKTAKHQALVMGFSDTFAVIGVVLVIAAVAVLLTRKVTAAGVRRIELTPENAC
jgi:DHA2 family multidrug resistance protein